MTLNELLQTIHALREDLLTSPKISSEFIYGQEFLVQMSNAEQRA
jgi:hypothetical protein